MPEARKSKVERTPTDGGGWGVKGRGERGGRREAFMDDG